MSVVRFRPWPPLFKKPTTLGWFFSPVPPVLARFPGMASRAPPLQTPCFQPRRRLSVLRFLHGSRERARGHFLCWRGFAGDWLWLATAGWERPSTEQAQKNRLRRLLALAPTRSHGRREHPHLVTPAAGPRTAHHLLQHSVRRAHQPFHDIRS